MADQITPNLGLVKPEIGASRNTWGQKLWDDLDILDTVIAQAQADINAEEAARLAADNLEIGVRAAAITSEELIRTAADAAEAAARIAGDAAEAALRVAGDAAEAAARAAMFQEAVLVAPLDITALSFTNATGVQVNLVPGTYVFDIRLRFQQAPESGVFFGVDGPTLSTLNWLGQFTQSTSSVASRNASAYNQSLAAIIPAGVSAGVMQGVVVVTGTGGFGLRVHVASGTITLAAGTCIRARRLA